ncbi:MAG: diguanylate cyclase [Kiritimatiellia bacterium]
MLLVLRTGCDCTALQWAACNGFAQFHLLPTEKLGIVSAKDRRMDTTPPIKKDAHILVVEDEPKLREMLKSALENSGYRCSVAATAEEAMERAETERYDLMIADIKLPGMNGLDLTDRIRRNQDTICILMTAFANDYSYQDAVARGASDFILKPVDLQELLLRIVRALAEREAQRERDRMLEQIRLLAITDGLTRLYNSRHFYSQLKLEVERAYRYKRPLSLLLLDVDNFKLYNDAHGHLKGDCALIKIADILKTCLRSMDTAYRYGGEEFTVILPETTGQAAATVAERIRATVENTDFDPPAPVGRVTVSIGVTSYYRGEDLQEFVRRADKAMYRMKKVGRNRVEVILPPEEDSNENNK